MSRLRVGQRIAKGEGDRGASLLMVMFAVVFVAGILSLMLTSLDGGIRQNTQLAGTQANRVAVDSAIQGAMSVVARSGFAASTGSSLCPTQTGTVVYHSPDPTVGNVTVVCSITAYGSQAGDGSDNLNLGADALVLTDTSDSNGAFVQSGQGWVVVSGNVRANGAGGANSIFAYGKSGKTCSPIEMVPGTQSPACGQVLVDNGAVWAQRPCTNPGVYAGFGVNCNNLFNGVAANPTYAGDVITITNKWSSQLTPLSTLTSGLVAQPATSITCSAPSKATKAPATLYLQPGYYGKTSTSDTTTLLNQITGGSYYVDNSGNCTTTKKNNSPIADVVMNPGVYVFGLSATWTISNGVNVVAGTSLLETDSSSSTGYYVCDATQPGAQFIFGSIAAGTQAYGIAMGNSSGRGALTVCGKANDSTSIAAGGPATVSMRGLSSAQVGSSFAVAGATLYPEPPCSPTVGKNNLVTSGCALLTNTAYGSFNVSGFAYLPSDSVSFIVDPGCDVSSVTNKVWGAIDCEFNPSTYNAPGQGAQVAFGNGLLADGMLATNQVSTGVTGSQQGNGSQWAPTLWLPTVSVPTAPAGLKVRFTATGTSTVTGAFTGTADAVLTNQLGAGAAWTNVVVTGWNNW